MARPPVAQLIWEQRTRLGLSIRQAAATAGISEGSWRRTESNRKLTRTPETIARMAGAVGITGEQLTAKGWPQAAEILATLSQPEPEPGPIPLTDAEVRATLTDLQAKLDEVLRALRRSEEGPNESNGERRAI